MKYLFLAYFGGSTYVTMEVFWRGRSHWTMFILGALCFIALGLVNKVLTWNTPLLIQMILGGLIITCLEFVTGCIVNLWLHWNIWNYTNQLNLLGQISLPSSIGWCFLSVIGIVSDDYIRYWFFGEEKPQYKLL
jgi:uncharacterized membrane protein